MATEWKLKRITVKYKHPNPLFEKWITEWLEKAKERDSKMQQIFKNALITLKKYPLPLDSGRECIILHGFGRKLCHMLDKKLAQHKTNCELNNRVNFVESTSKCSENNINLKNQNGIKNKVYKPMKGSGAYAILLVLIKNNQYVNDVKYLSKAEIIEQAKEFCESNTVWSSMCTLIKREIVFKSGSPPKFSLTESGKAIASGLIENDKIVQIPDLSENINHNLDVEKPPSLQNTVKVDALKTLTQAESTETIIFAPYTFDIILLVDTQETAGATVNALDDETISELNALNVNFEVRHLKVGDFTWICREKNSGHELVLPYIVERKRIDDLGQSIKDGRFHEQKFRLKQSGVQNLIYVVESYKNNSHTGLPLSSLMQAAANTLIQDNFQVKFTQNHRHSMQYLSGFTKILTGIYEGKNLMSCSKDNLKKSTVTDDLIPLMSFKEFNKGASKIRSFRLKELFARQLLQLKGVSVDKALAIIEKYPSPRSLKGEYDRLGKSGDKLLANIQYGPMKRSIGAVISNSIYQLYTSKTLS